MLNTPIKASRIDNLTDARYFAAWYVNWLGFNLDVDMNDANAIAKIKAIRDWVEGSSMVGEFGLQEPQVIREVVKYLNLDVVQLSHFTKVEDAESLRDLNLFKEVVFENLSSVSAALEKQKVFAPYVSHFVLDFRRAGITWRQLSPNVNTLFSDFCLAHNIVLSIDFKADELTSILSKIKLAGLEVVGGEEEKIGFKSFDELDEIFETLEEN